MPGPKSRQNQSPRAAIELAPRPKSAQKMSLYCRMAPFPAPATDGPIVTMLVRKLDSYVVSSDYTEEGEL
jgi:hypothetical protein